MLVYIWFRFELQFGLGAVVALFHDVILTFGLFAITQHRVLADLGRRHPDHHRLFDERHRRGASTALRENLRKYKRMPLGELIDLSINETLSRTMITGITALLALAVLAVFGGPALSRFSVAMIFGIVIGTYSSIYRRRAGAPAAGASSAARTPR